MPGWDQLVDLISSGIQYLYQLTGNSGIAIILFTIFVKFALLPLTLPALRNSKKQQELAPEIREIQKRTKGDRAAASREQMELYQQYGFNPLSGCLPTLVQLPIFFALWIAIRNLASTPAGQDAFLWLPQIAQPDPYRLLPVLAAVAQFFQTRMAMQPQAQVVDPNQRSMNRMMQFMPLMVIVFGWNFASGAVLYWLVSSLVSAVQQWFVTGWGSLLDLLPFLPDKKRKSLLPPRNLRAAAERKPGMLGRFQDRMMEAQQQAEAQRQAKSQAATGSKAAVTPVVVAAPAPTTPTIVESEDIRLTDDAWQLPGAPGSTGRGVFATGTADSGPTSRSNGTRPTSNANNAQRRTTKRKRR